MNNISVNVFALEFDHKSKNHIVIGPLHHTRNRKQNHVNLLYLENDSKYHYVWIKNLSRLVSHQLNKNEHKMWICDGCLVYFPTEENFLRHQNDDCNYIATFLPNENENVLKFTHFERKLKVPFIIYADFESLQIPYSTCIPTADRSFTNNTHVHEPYSFAYFIKCSYNNELNKFRIYSGKDVSHKFVDYITNDIKDIYENHLKKLIPMLPLTDTEINNYNSTNFCHICERKIEIVDKVRDHCHLTGRFRGPAHSSCNLNFKIAKFIPIFLHNLTNYDCHLFIRSLAFDNESIEVIPKNKEKYISFTKKILVDKIDNKNIYLKMRFLDSYRFMNKSLCSLARNLKPEQLTNTSKYFLITQLIILL